MCSTCDCSQVADKLVQDLRLTEPVGNDKLKPCRRCGASDPYIIMDKVHVECRQCFLESCNKKIRSTIGRSRLLANNDPILIAYSGGPSSCALLDLIKTSMSPINKRDQKFRPSLLHVDMQLLQDAQELTNDMTRSSRLKSILDKLKSSYPEWPIYWTSFETCFKRGQTNDSDCPIFALYDGVLDTSSAFDTDAQSRLKEHLSRLDLTDRQQFVQDSLVELINLVAAQINTLNQNPDQHLKYVFKACTSTKLANDLLVGTILGRGSTLRPTVDICDSRPPVPIVRPMREFSKKEVAFYLRGKGIEPLVEKNLLTFAARKASIQTVTESFLSKLYVDYPSTYSTLLRTGNKLL